MSDFDKEAEREKLREKYEQDKQERKATQRMSDLLLKGATMTNAHCGTCGDPLFQQNGTTFCPSCHGNPDAVEGTDLEAQPADDAPTDDGNGAVDDPAAADTPAGTASQAAGSEGPRAEPGAVDATEPADQHRGEPSPASSDATRSNAADRTRSTPADTDRSTQPTADADGATRDAPRPTADDRSTDPEPPRRAPAASPSVEGDLENARDTLVRSIEKFAAEAAATDDPRYARDCLEAAREAGEALSTLR